MAAKLADATNVQIEISTQVLFRLFANGQLCAAEFRSLNTESKQAIWQLCLSACEKCLASETEAVHKQQEMISVLQQLDVTEKGN